MIIAITYTGIKEMPKYESTKDLKLLAEFFDKHFRYDLADCMRLAITFFSWEGFIHGVGVNTEIKPVMEGGELVIKFFFENDLIKQRFEIMVPKASFNKVVVID